MFGSDNIVRNELCTNDHCPAILHNISMETDKGRLSLLRNVIKTNTKFFACDRRSVGGNSENIFIQPVERERGWFCFCVGKQVRTWPASDKAYRWFLLFVANFNANNNTSGSIQICSPPLLERDARECALTEKHTPWVRNRCFTFSSVCAT